MRANSATPERRRIDITKAAYDDANLDVTFVAGTPVTFKITEKAVTITINGSSDSKVYNGSEQTSETTVTPSSEDSLFDASKFSYTGATTITKTNVGEYSEAIDITKAAYADDNLDVTFAAGTPVTFEITKAPLTITADSNSKVYDGDPLTDDGWKDTAPVGLKGTDAVESVTVTGTQTLVGSSDNVATAAVVKNGETDVTANYDITYVNGTLTVTDENVPDNKVVTKDDDEDNTKKYHVGETVEWTIWVKNIYDAEKSLTVTEVEGMTIVDEDSIPKTLTPGQEITITVQHVVTAADVVAGSIKNEVKVKLDDLEKTGDDTVETEPIAITITAASQTRQYNGTALTNNGYSITSGKLTEGDKIDSITVTGSQLDVGSSANVPSNAKIVNKDGEDVTKGYKITYANGTLTVTTVPYTINYVFTWPGGAAPAGAPTPPAAATVNRGANYTVSTATYADIPYGIAPNGNVITVLRFQGWDTTGTINNVRSNRTITGAWTIQMVWYTVTYTDGVPGEVVFPDQVTTTLSPAGLPRCLPP